MESSLHGRNGWQTPVFRRGRGTDCAIVEAGSEPDGEEAFALARAAGFEARGRELTQGFLVNARKEVARGRGTSDVQVIGSLFDKT